MYIIGLYSMMLLAFLLGWYGENIAYFFEEHLTVLNTLLVVTVVSIALFIIAYIIGTILLAKGKVKPKMYMFFFTVNIVVGLLVSVRSIFFLAMGWQLL
ncbi:hypothetical protein [Alkalibacillus haloalkaliphilus]|uniref:Uncharacterized protein n=1 Tax=Alkalibacillus haloalkaliphilus TaxID=94136 RepID=A0A511W3F1_9BACI|nr:hypothetical protein [Alkalibacillus haloalkaliphilus]GEN45616.1 hypothetical protein AHA02nite_13920 [Alkalibacillus haloalkaliphilus]